MKHPIALSLLLAALAGAGPAAALSRAPSPAVTLEIVDRDDGQDLAQYRHRGQAWVAGEPGHRYAVRLRNQGPQRVLVVLSVDGVNAISGQTADTGQAGYVLGPWQVLEVDGWRKSMDAVAQFVFVDPARSYAAHAGGRHRAGGRRKPGGGEDATRTAVTGGRVHVPGRGPGRRRDRRPCPLPGHTRPGHRPRSYRIGAGPRHHLRPAGAAGPGHPIAL